MCKGVLKAILVFAMSVFPITDFLIDLITSVIRNFSWSQNKERFIT